MQRSVAPPALTGRNVLMPGVGSPSAWVDGQACPPPGTGSPCPAGGLRDVYVATTYSNYANDDLAALTEGHWLDKRFAINWDETTGMTTLSYVLRFKYQSPDGHGNVRFTCVAFATGACTQWTAVPVGPAELYLKHPATRNAKAHEELIGVVSMPFSMALTKK